MNSSCLKVTVNGKKFLITGIRKEVSRKDLLCALAKTSDKTLEQFKHSGLVAKQRECVVDELSKSTSDENLLSLLKGDRETAGDYESLKILNSLGKNARIVKRGSENRGEIKNLSRKSHKRTTPSDKEKKQQSRGRKKYTRELNVDKPLEKRPEKCTRISKRIVNRLSAPSELSPKRILPKDKFTLGRRSVDDSDIDSYKQVKLSKLKRRQSRCYDDSDIDIYQSLYNIVLDQTIKLHKTHSESKQIIKRSSWLEENLKVYYIDDVNSRQHNNTAGKIKTNNNNDNTSNITYSNNSINEQTMNTSASAIYGNINDDVDIDNDNDSGLPSPEYDSSESTDNQPIRLQRTITMLQSKNDSDMSTDQNIDSVIKSTYIKSKQLRDVNENITTLQNGVHTDNGEFNEHDDSTQDNTRSNNKLKCGKLANYNEDVYLQRRSKSLGDLLLNSRGESGTLPTTLNSEHDIFTYNIADGVIGDIDEEKVRYILQNLTSDKIINMGVLNPTFLSNAMKSKKKLEKKKINKCDISEPQLLSPTQFRRYGSLKSVQTAALLLKNGISFGSIGRSVTIPTGEKDEERKDKEKFYNKKLMEVRRSKRSSKSSGKSDASSSSHSKTKEKDKFIPPDKPPGDKKISRSIEKKHSKERDKHKDYETHEKISKEKKDSHKHRDEHKHRKYNYKREKSFDTTTTTTTTTSDQNDDTRSCRSSSRSSSIEPESKHKRELDINDIERQILELNKLKSQQKNKECSSEKFISENSGVENSSNLDNSNIVEVSNSNEEIDYRTNNEQNGQNEGDEDDELRKNDKCSHDDINDALETTSDYSSLNENIKLECIDEMDMERSELITLFTREEAAVNELIERILDYNLLIGELSEEIDILKTERGSNESIEDLIAEEENIYNEIDSVRSLLQSVVDLCAYQRKEMSENLALLDKLDTKVRTKKAGYEILKSGEWRTNSKSAPRSLLKYSKEKKTIVKQNSANENSSVV